jgi:hypothetical protein
MATEAQVRKYLDPEEPDYKAAAAALGADALPVLEMLVQGSDPLLASKAAYLASLIPDDEAARVLEQAARSDDPTVRVAAAAGLQKRSDVANDVAAELMTDPDPGVRKVAAKTTGGRKTPGLRARISETTPDDREDAARPSAAPERTRRTTVQVLEGEHGGGFPPGTTARAERAEGEGGGDLARTQARSSTEMAGTDPESGGGGDVGRNVGSRAGRSDGGPDGGGLLSGRAGDTSMHGGGNT